jgi:hypothetical protein
LRAVKPLYIGSQTCWVFNTWSFLTKSCIANCLSSMINLFASYMVAYNTFGPSNSTVLDLFRCASRCGTTLPPHMPRCLCLIKASPLAKPLPLQKERYQQQRMNEEGTLEAYHGHWNGFVPRCMRAWRRRSCCRTKAALLRIRTVVRERTVR